MRGRIVTQDPLYEIKKSIGRLEREVQQMRKGAQTPTHPVYGTLAGSSTGLASEDSDPLDPVEGQIAWRGPRTDPHYYRHGAWHPFGQDISFGAASYYGTIASGSNVDIIYDQFVTSDAGAFALSGGGRLQVLGEGTYAFFQAAYVYPSGSPAASSEVTLTPSVTADSFHAVPTGFYWPDFGHYTVVGTTSGTLQWSPHMLTFRTYNDDGTSFPAEQHLLMTIPFATSNCIVSTLALRIRAGLPNAF